MTPRERVKAVLEHKEADRVVIENNSVVSSIHVEAYKNLINHLKLDEDKENIPLICFGQRIAKSSEEVLKRLHVDTRYIFPNFPSYWKYEELPDGGWYDMFGTKYVRCGLYCDIGDPVMKNFTLRDLKQYKWPDPRDKKISEGLKEQAKALYNNTDYALVSGWQPAIFYFGWELRGIEQFTMDTLINKEFAAYLMDALTDWIVEYLDNILSEISEYVEYQWYADDWGVQNGPFISPEQFRDEMMPREKKIFDLVHSKGPKVCHHTCGATAWVISDLSDIGVDIVHPVQSNAFGNENAKILKEQYGDLITFHGNTNNQGLFHKSKEHVIADALYRIKYLGPGGGYIFSGGHNIQVNCPPENILALFDTAYDFGTYPINEEKIDNRIKELLVVRPEIKDDLPFIDQNL